jgi:hypothetical protein
MAVPKTAATTDNPIIDPAAPAPAPATSAVPPTLLTQAAERPAWLGGPAGRPNTWEYTWRTKDGYTETHRTRGPETEAEIRKVIAQNLGAMTKLALDSGAEDPGLVCISLKAVGRDDSPFDGRQPAGTRPVDIFQFAKPAPQTAEEAATWGQQQA